LPKVCCVPTLGPVSRSCARTLPCEASIRVTVSRIACRSCKQRPLRNPLGPLLIPWSLQNIDGVNDIQKAPRRARNRGVVCLGSALRTRPCLWLCQGGEISTDLAEFPCQTGPFRIFLRVLPAFNRFANALSVIRHLIDTSPSAFFSHFSTRAAEPTRNQANTVDLDPHMPSRSIANFSEVEQPPSK